MDAVETKLSILIDGMGKKEQALKEIANITENQGTVLASDMGEDEIRTFLVQMNREKQVYIQTVLQCDNLFERVLKEIGPELDAQPNLYNRQIGDLQQRIRRVMDLDVKIRVYEDENNKKTASSKPKQAAMPIAAKIIPDEKRVIKAYEKNSRNHKG